MNTSNVLWICYLPNSLNDSTKKFNLSYYLIFSNILWFLVPASQQVLKLVFLNSPQCHGSFCCRHWWVCFGRTYMSCWSGLWQHHWILSLCGPLWSRLPKNFWWAQLSRYNMCVSVCAMNTYVYVYFHMCGCAIVCAYVYTWVEPSGWPISASPTQMYLLSP